MTNRPESPVNDLIETGQIDQGGLHRAVQSLRDRRYRWWFICQIFSSSGAMTQSVARPGAASWPCSPGVAMVVTAYSPVVPGAFAGLALSGFFSIWLIAAANTLVQLRAGPALRGRVMGIWTMALPGSYPVSGLLVALVSGVSPAPFGTSLIVAPRTDEQRTLDETRSGHGT